ncbi:bifunctional enoyl-CoA hydratase/phosphate acetyltransferase [Salisediminibacterium halotolerans]|uniref:Phosphate butyryltransferase n=1 Tax=Salisediminibacterium halotolerans TaxID=517425 RepID=A0A1H9PEU3_9BACI|nr:bifunctional enoyl-CoA hydratase/phosphate acetyltransferase [Salisediminibacterium haloalkalitolerans]SER46660.1 phosphate butyryltransferase [Salisediminibacterium haloalkalitolerans]
MNWHDLNSSLQLPEYTPTVAVADASDASLFEMAEEAIKMNVCRFHFHGTEERMKKAAAEANFSFSESEYASFFPAEDSGAAGSAAVRDVRGKNASVLMKGMIDTGTLLKSVLSKEDGLRTGNILSHLAAFSLPGRDALLYLSDSAMNIAPDLSEKKQIVENAANTVQKIGIEKPKIAVLAAVETVNPSMQATLDAAALAQMSSRGQLGKCEVDGPLGFDNAVSETAAAKKNISSAVAGKADILIAPEIETANVLYKSLTYFGGATVGGILAGAAAPVVLTSRTDTVESKLFSLLLGLSAVKNNENDDN